MREEFDQLLFSTGRPGIEDLLHYMFMNGFYTAPCSSQHHLCKEGGLLEHSLNVINCMNSLASELLTVEEYSSLKDSIIIMAALHDLGKMGQFGKPHYIPNHLKSELISATKPYKTNKDLLNVPHEVRSIQIASQFINLTEEESWAILMHNGLYGDFKYQIQGNETKLYMLLNWADMWTSRVLE